MRHTDLCPSLPLSIWGNVLESKETQTWEKGNNTEENKVWTGWQEVVCCHMRHIGQVTQVTRTSHATSESSGGKRFASKVLLGFQLKETGFVLNPWLALGHNGPVKSHVARNLLHAIVCCACESCRMRSPRPQALQMRQPYFSFIFTCPWKISSDLLKYFKMIVNSTTQVTLSHTYWSQDKQPITGRLSYASWPIIWSCPMWPSHLTASYLGSFLHKELRWVGLV